MVTTPEEEMFNGFTEETIQFFLDLKFHNNTAFFHEQHDRYVEDVQQVFYGMIDELAGDMLKIDPGMEVRPHKCLSRIHRDTRFSRDKSPYRDHLWFLFRRAGEPRDKSLFYYFELGPDRLSWGMGFWNENREALDLFRRRIRANPDDTLALLDDMDLVSRKLYLGGSVYKKMTVPPDITLEKLGKVILNDNRVTAFMNGNSTWSTGFRVVERSDFDEIYRVYAGGEFLGSAAIENGSLVPKKVFR